MGRRTMKYLEYAIGWTNEMAITMKNISAPAGAPARSKVEYFLIAVVDIWKFIKFL